MKEHIYRLDPPMLGDKSVKLVIESEGFIVFYIPGRTVYINADEGSQYQNAEYVVLEKLGNFYGKEILRFNRSI